MGRANRCSYSRANPAQEDIIDLSAGRDCLVLTLVSVQDRPDGLA